MAWHVIYTKARYEKKVHEGLMKKSIDSYCPLNRVIKQWSDRKKKIEIPLFTSYVFVNITEAEQLTVRMTAGVVNFVYWLGKPAIISNKEMIALKDFVDNNENIIVQQLGYKEGDSIEIDGGIFQGQKAIISKVNKNKLELILQGLQLKLLVER